MTHLVITLTLQEYNVVRSVCERIMEADCYRNQAERKAAMRILRKLKNASTIQDVMETIGLRHA